MPHGIHVAPADRNHHSNTSFFCSGMSNFMSVSFVLNCSKASFRPRPCGALGGKHFHHQQCRTVAHEYRTARRQSRWRHGVCKLRRLPRPGHMALQWALTLQLREGQGLPRNARTPEQHISQRPAAQAPHRAPGTHGVAMRRDAAGKHHRPCHPHAAALHAHNLCAVAPRPRARASSTLSGLAALGQYLHTENMPSGSQPRTE